MSLVTEINALVTRIATEIKGKANVVHTHAAGDINSGTLSTARMGTGTANSTTVLYGDNTWKAAPTGGGGGTTQHFDVRTYGATVDGSTNDTTALAAAISAAGTAGGGTVFIPQGTLITDPFTLPSKVRLQGSGWNTIVKRRLATPTGAFVKLANTSAFQVQVESLIIDGSNLGGTTEHLLEFDNGSIQLFDSHPDPMHLITNVMFRNGNGDGIRIIGNARETRVVDVQVRRVSKVGVRVEWLATDCQFTNVVVDSAGKAGDTAGGGNYGFFLNAPNTRMTNCKAFWCGSNTSAGAGFMIGDGCHRSTFVGCEAQDNGGHGFVIYNSNDVILQGCNGNGNSSSGIRLDGALNVQVDTFMATNHAGGRYQQWFISEISNSPTGVMRGGANINGGGINGSLTSMREVHFVVQGGTDIKHNVYGFIVLNASDPVPAGTAEGTLIVRRA